MQQSYATHMVRNTAAATSATPSANCASSDTLFRLECVLLFALDVVRGPYIHSCAPAHPPEAIRSFLESQAAPASSSAYSAATAAAANPALAKASAEMIGDDVTTLSPAGFHCDAATVAPYTKMASPAMHSLPSFGACSIGGGDSGLRTASFSSTIPTPPPAPCSASSPTHPLTSAVDASPSLELWSLQHTARTPLLKEQQLSPLSLANRTGAAAGLSASVLGDITGGDTRTVSSPAAQGRLVGLSDTTAQAETRAYAVDTSGTNHAASEDNAAFSFPPQTYASELPLTLPRPPPMVGSSALAASPSTGGGDALAVDTSPGEYGGESTHTNDGHCRDARSEAARGVERRANVDSGTTPTPRLAKAPAVTATTDVYCSNTTSPSATPVRTLPMATASPNASSNSGVAVPRAAAERCAVAEGQQQFPHHDHHPQSLLPSSPQVSPSLHIATTAATRGTLLPSTSTTAATTAADNGRMSGYNDVFVPRSEFCRRVLWLYPAESGLLFLYYPEDIPGEHYQRKTLRYSLCLVFRVDHKRMTIGDGLLHQLVHPYSVVLTNIAEELREAELKYAYMIRGLRSFNSASWQVSRLAVKSPTSSLPTAATTAFSVAAQSPVTSSMAGAHVAEVAEDVDEGVGQAHPATPPAPPSGALQKPYTLVRGRVTGQVDTMAPSTAVAMTVSATLTVPSSTSANPNSYHLPFLEHSGAVAAGGDNRPHTPTEMADRTSTSLMSPSQLAAPVLGDERTEAHGSAETATATASGGCSSQQCDDGARVAQDRRDGDGRLLPSGVHGCGDSSSLATTAAIAVVAGNANSGVRSSSSYLTSMQSLEINTAPPSSSLPVRSRTVSETAATFHPPSAQPQALEESTSMAASSSAACSSFSLRGAPTSAPHVALSGAVKSHYSGGRQQQQHSTAGASVATSPRVPSPFQGPVPTTAVASMHILNAFITPPTEPKWTPLSELVDELFRCLSYTTAPDGDGDREREGQIGSLVTDGRTPLTASPMPAGAALGLAAQQPEGALGAGMSKALVQRQTSTTLASPTGQQQQQQCGDTSVVHLSNRLSFHVRRMAPLQPARLLHFDHVPVPVVVYDPQMMEWMDMAVHHVFQLVDGVRTVADLVFSVAMGTTTTLAEVYADALQRCVAEQQAAPVTAQGTTSAGAGASAAQRSPTANRDRPRSAAVKAVAPLSAPGTAAAAAAPVEVHGSGEPAAEGAHVAGRSPSAAGSPRQSIVVSVPIDVHPCPSLLPGVRYPAPTSAAAAAISDGQASLPSHVNVRVAPAAASGAGAPNTGASVRSGANGVGIAAPITSGVPNGSGISSTAASSPPPPQISVELPPTWVATAGIVMEALLHLELCHLIKVYRPWTERTLYSTTHSAQRVLCSLHHPARHVLGHYLLCMAWAERQECREERRGVIAKWKQIRKTSVKARRVPVASHATTSVVAERQHASTRLGMASTPQQSSTAAEVSSPSSFTEPAAALAVMPASGVSSRAAATNATVAVRSPDHLIDRSGWSPPAAPRLSSSVPCASEVHCRGQHQQRPHPPPPLTPVAYPGSTPIPHSPQSDAMLMGVGATQAGVLDPSSIDAHASSAPTSLAPSPLRHALSIGASGRLQMTLMSSLPALSLLRSGPSSGAAVSGTSQRFFVGSQGSQTCGGGLLPCAVTGASYGSSYSQQQRRHQHLYEHGCSHATPLRSCSSTSSSEDSCASVSRRSSSSTSSSVSSDSGNSSVSSSSSSSACPMPITASAMQPLAVQASATPAKIGSPGLPSLTPSAAGENMLAQGSKGAAAADIASRSAQHPLKLPSADGAAIERSTAEPTAASALRAAESQATGIAAAEVVQREKRRRRQPPLKVFAPTEAAVSRAAAAALCALAKFNNASVLSVQEEMRRIPVWATSFNHWSDRCVKALVEVAVLNNWLEDVS